MTRSSVVLIHGVGDVAAGRSLTDVVSGLGMLGAPAAAREDLIINHTTYPRAVFSEGPIREIIEVNWSDLGKPVRTYWGVLSHLLQLLVGLLGLAAAPVHPANKKPVIAGFYRVFFESILVWCGYPYLFTLYWLTSDSPLKHWAAVIFWCVAVGAFAIYLGQMSRWFYCGLLWSLYLPVLALLSFWKVLSDPVLVFTATKLISTGQSLVVVIQLIAIVEVIRYSRSAAREYVLYRLALIYVPMVAMSGIGAAIAALAILGGRSWSNNSTSYSLWGQYYYSSLGYDLAVMEVAFAGAVALIGVVALAGVAKYFAGRARVLGSRTKNGRSAQDWIVFTLQASLVILLAIAILMGYSSIVGTPSLESSIVQTVASVAGPASTGSTKADNVIAIYTVSALRLVPFLPFLISPLSVLVHILGGVVFYLLPDDHPLSMRRKCQSRFADVLKSIASRSERILVVAHSQGSVIAVDTLSMDAKVKPTVITAGSPLASFYERFLLSVPAERTGSAALPVDWTNIYREDDYIAGPIAWNGVRNLTLPGGEANELWTDPHTGYWADSGFCKELLRLAS